MPEIVCITGMHRSGTSLTASWLQECGLKIDNGQLYGSDTGNVKGHYEDKEFVDLQSKSIQRQNSNSKGWIVSRQDFSFNNDDIDFARQLIQARNKNKIWGWKDPRSALFLEDWKRLIYDLKYIFLWRPAVDVVHSLKERSKASTKRDYDISSRDAYRTWIAYNLEILEFLKFNNSNCVLINIYDLIQKDERIFNLLRENLNLDLNYSSLNSIVDKELIKTRTKALKDKASYNIRGIDKIEMKLYNYSIG